MKNITTYFFLVLICFAFAFAFAGLSHIANFLGWIFIIITAGLFFYSGKNFVDQGVFCSNGWKIIFLLFIPLIFYIDKKLNTRISWYNDYGGLAYYALFTLGFIIKKIPNKIATFAESVEKYEIIEKYQEDPKWATLLYFEDGRIEWNKTITGSFCAKDSENDLTFVHSSKEEAEDYSSNIFVNAIKI